MGLSKDDVPQEVEEAIMDSHGEHEGQEWLDSAFDRLDQLEDDWDFDSVEVLGGGENSLLVKVEPSSLSDDTAVIKIPTDVRSGCDEIAALKIWEDCNVPVVKNEDTITGVFMMDYVSPTDKSVSPFQAFVFADVLHTPALNFDYKFPTLEESLSHRIAEAFHRHDTEEAEDFWLAVKTVETLLATQDHEELLHGDYRNANIIYSDNGPIIIAPQPCVGDSLFDIALWLSESREYEDIAVVLQIAGPAGERLIPWIWSLAILTDVVSPAAEVFKGDVMAWLDKQDQNPSGLIDLNLSS
jgi:hypothetical protein